MKASSRTEWTKFSFIAPLAMVPRLISRLTKSMLRSSRKSEALKLISLIRFRISVAVPGTSERSTGLMCTMKMSGHFVR